MINTKLLNKMNEAETIQESKLHSKHITVSNYNFLKVRDYLIIDGYIVDEDLKNQIYTAYYRSGFLNLSRSLVGIMLERDQLLVASTSDKLVNKIIDDLSSDKKGQYPRKQNIKNYLSIFVIFLLTLVITISGFVVYPAVTATGDYNDAIENFNNLAKEYNNEVAKVFVENIEGVPGEVDLLSKVEEDFISVSSSIINGNSSSKIRKDIATINSMIQILKEGKIIIENIYIPSSQEIESRLANIDEIDQIKSVTPDNDPNEMLGKEHGYVECVYFTIDGLSIDGITSTDPIILGTNGGGCIEVYSNIEDAMNRCEYLSQFDNTLLYSGSYAVVGTMVIRTSYVLTEHQQYTLTNYIVEQFTKI